MKICPQCALSNEECFPACLWCNTLLADVRSTPSTDPRAPEHRQRALAGQRQKATRRQLGFAAVSYTLAITFLAVCPGFVFNPLLLLAYFGSSVVVAGTALAEWTGPFSASLLQGFLGLALVLHFGPVQPFVFFMLLGHVTFPPVFCHWIEMIHEANR